MLRRALATLAAVLVASTAPAAGCDTAADQASLDECTGKAFEKADATLNGLYGQVRSRLKNHADETKLMVAAQRAWVGFRDAECAFGASGVTGGSAYPMVALQCKEALTAARSAGLRDYLKCQEGDLGCPVPPR